MFLVVSGLPRSIDAKDVELIYTRRSLSSTHETLELSQSQTVSNENGNETSGESERTNNRGLNSHIRKGKKKKLKVIAISKKDTTSSDKNGRFAREGEFNDRFRTPYTKSEEASILRYFRQYRVFSRRKGTTIWKQMERANICPGRSWQSMKQICLKLFFKKWENKGIYLDSSDISGASSTSECVADK